MSFNLRLRFGDGIGRNKHNVLCQLGGGNRGRSWYCGGWFSGSLGGATTTTRDIVDRPSQLLGRGARITKDE